MARQGVEAESWHLSLLHPQADGFSPLSVGTGGRAVGTSLWVAYARVLMEAN